MPQPSYIGSGTTPKKGDTWLILVAKRLGAIQNGLGAPNQANNPERKDTWRELYSKILAAENGL